MPYKKTNFSWDVLEALATRGATGKDCSWIMDCSQDTIEREIRKRYKMPYSEYKDGKMSKTRMKLIEVAISKAIKGDNTMLIFCLKNLCGWKDKWDNDSTTVVANVTNVALNESEHKELVKKARDWK